MLGPCFTTSRIFVSSLSPFGVFILTCAVSFGLYNISKPFLLCSNFASSIMQSCNQSLPKILTASAKNTSLFLFSILLCSWSLFFICFLHFYCIICQDFFMFLSPPFINHSAFNPTLYSAFRFFSLLVLLYWPW